VTLCLVSSFLLTGAVGQDRNVDGVSNRAGKIHDINKTLLPDKIGNEWKAMGNPHTLDAAQFSALPDGDVYAEYGLITLTTRFYTNGKAKAAVELFQTHFASEAYGLFTFIQGYSDKNRLAFYKGQFLAGVSCDGEDTNSLQSIIDVLKKNITLEEGDLPSLPFNLPEEGKVRNTEKYVIGPVALERIKEFSDLKDVVNFNGGTYAAIANYQTAGQEISLAVFEYHTPQLATDGYTRFQNYLESIPTSKKSSRLLRRIGNYIVIADNVREAGPAEAIIAKIKYSPQIYWEGKKITNVPIQFRPADPIAIEEASQTANMIIRTFYWIGVMIFAAILIGFVAGSSLFYWNRYRRQKLGIDDVFSDAGGTVRLNLDDYLLDPSEYPLKRITENRRERDKKNGGHN
jgi:hypothetical protein